MNMIALLIPLSLVLVVAAAWAFVWAVNSGQFDDLDTPAWDMLSEDENPAPSSNKTLSGTDTSSVSVKAP
jgi:cbb3-type cytochrome oxidase maturation protein